jgi:hypothetical protein
MAKDANGKRAQPEDDVPAVNRDLAKLAVQIATLSPRRLELLGEMLSRAGREEHAQLLEEVELRQKLRAHMGRFGAGFWVLAGAAILVATVMRVSYLAARPFVGFGLLGAVLLLAGLRRWYRASEVRERVTMIDADESDDDEPDDDSTEVIESGDGDEEERQTRPLPQLRNTDGEKFAFIEDHYELVGEGARAAIEAELAKMPDVEPASPGAGDRRYAVVRENGGDSAIGDTVIGSIWVRAHEVVVESNSRKRAKQMRKRIEAAFGNRVHFVRREEKSVGEAMAEMAKSAGNVQPALEGPEIDAVLRAFKARHYATWADESLPALDGLTPREAAAKPKYRARLERLLKEMEHGESQVEPGRRFDFGAIRRTLGMG